MATYLELRQVSTDSDLQDKVTVAITVAANAILNEDPGTSNHANRLIWAKDAFNNPRGLMPGVMAAVISANKDAIVANILGASDATIQTAVDAAVDLFAGS